jgi:hypothetical protein
MRIADSQMNLATLLLMDELKQNKSNKSNITNDLMLGTQAVKSALPKPDWNRIPSKDVAMSEEEFEEAIRALALKTAEKGMAMGDATKGKDAFTFEEMNLLTKYISTASPDRKAAYESYKGNDNTIYGKPNQEIMLYAGGIWSAKYTNDELSKWSEFYGIYQNTIREYEAENGKIPDTGKSNYSNPYKLLSEYNTYNLLNQFA